MDVKMGLQIIAQPTTRYDPIFLHTESARLALVAFA